MNNTIDKYIKIIAPILLVLLFSLLIKHSFIITAVIPSESMENTLEIDDYVIAIKYPSFLKKINRKDIVLIKHPSELDKKETLVKRVIGLPEETIYLQKNKVYIEDSKFPLYEPYVNDIHNTNKNFNIVYHIPQDSYVVLGDNRDLSVDTRSFGYIKRDQIIAKAIIKIYKTNKFYKISFLN